MTSASSPLRALRIGAPTAPDVVFAHGWGRDHRDFIPVAEALAPIANCHLLDLPGFGGNPRPEAGWGTADYARHIKQMLANDLGLGRYIWVGHSFGGRIGLRLGAMGAPLDHMVIAAGAGVPRARTRRERLKGKLRSWRFQAAKRRAADEAALIALEARYGSPDYVESRELGLRDIFLATISEDQSRDLARISCPTTLIYGADDSETPPEIGRKIAAGIAGARYIELPHFDHISILDRGRHQIALAIKEALAQRSAA